MPETQSQSLADDAANLKPPEALCRLPLFRPVAVKLLKLLAHEDVAFGEVAKMLSTDPAFSAEVLALANSPLYGTLCETTSLTRAIVVLGLDRTKALTMTVAMQAFVRNVQTTAELQRSWRHSLGCALIAEELAPLYGILRDHGYTVGLMHDLGRLGLLKTYAKPYAGLLANSYEAAGEILEAERRLFDVDHCQAGLWLTRSWGFPEEFWAVTALHHGGRFGRGQGVVGLASISCLLADALGFQSINYHKPVALEEAAATLPGRAGFDLAGLQQRIQERVKAVDL